MLNEVSEESKGFDIRENISPFSLKIQTQLFRLPFVIRKKLEQDFLLKANARLLTEIRSYNPGLVFVYNSEYLLPETCKEITKTSRLVFFMGDSPFYTPKNNYYLSCLSYADLILSPDSFWIQQLNTIGLNKTLYFIPGLDESSYYKITDFSDNNNCTDSEILYAGACYLNSWGYKKALLMSKFTGFDFRLYGNSAWKRWFNLFPALRDVYAESSYIPTGQLNLMFNKTKIVPVDGNPGILNGFHLRLFEALSAGAFPLIEYRYDVDNLLFRGFNGSVPVIKDYNKATDLASYYLGHDNERIEIARSLKEFIQNKYNPSSNAEALMEGLKRW
jgi:hypothetical protein